MISFVISRRGSLLFIHPVSSAVNAIEDTATSVKDEPNDDVDNNDINDSFTLNDSSPRASVSSLNHRTPPQSPRASASRVGKLVFAIIASAFPSEQRDRSLSPPYICDENQCTFPYPCIEPKSKKARSSSRIANSSL